MTAVSGDAPFARVDPETCLTFHSLALGICLFFVFCFLVFVVRAFRSPLPPSQAAFRHSLAIQPTRRNNNRGPLSTLGYWLPGHRGLGVVRPDAAQSDQA
jgi:hypothetical protein